MNVRWDCAHRPSRRKAPTTQRAATRQAVASPPVPTQFRALYPRKCVGTGGDATACRVAARCVVGAFRRDGLWAQSQRTFTVAERARAQALSQGCYEAVEGTAPAP